MLSYSETLISRNFYSVRKLNYNSGTEKNSHYVMSFVITPIQNNSDRQQKDDIQISPRVDSGIHSPASSMQQ